jgi:hypothetical protein
MLGYALHPHCELVRSIQCQSSADTYDQVELRAFAVKFCAWANVVLAPTKPVADRLSGGRHKIAKGSAVRIVGYHKN